MLQLEQDKNHFIVLHDMPGRCRLRIAGFNANQLVTHELEQRLRSCEFVNDFNINIACSSVVIKYRGALEVLFLKLAERSIPKLLDSPPRLGNNKLLPVLRDPKPLHSLALSGVALLLGTTIGPLLSVGLIVISGFPIWRRALSTLIFEKRLNVDFLDGLALTIAVLRQQPRTAALMALLVHLGDYVRERTAQQSRGYVQHLLELHTLKARRLEIDGTVTMVIAQTLMPNEIVLIVAGDMVPADGRVILGIAAVDQRHITGESMPANRRVGDTVFAGSSIVEGSITVCVCEAGDDTLASKIVQLVESAPIGETRIQNYAEQFADHLVAPMLGANVALLASSGNLDRFMSLAIVDYGTGIRVAAPTSILTSMTRAAQEGILIKSGRHVESLATMKGIAFDKTGTLTCGRLTVLEVKTFDAYISSDTVLQLAAAAETELSHPVARALVTYARSIRGLELPICEDVQFKIGLGVTAVIQGKSINIGSERYLRQMHISTSKAKSYMQSLDRLGHIGLLVAVDHTLVGAIACSDEPRPEARSILSGMRQRGIGHIVMLSGDKEGVARRVAQMVGIDTVYSEVLPHEKASIIHDLRKAHGTFAMVGDGVNDSPALAQADIGISLMDGADIARTAADVVLMKEGLHLLLPAIDISRDALKLIKQNCTLIASLNTLALALALPSGLISPATCTILSNGSTLLATLNSMRPLLPNLGR